MTLSFYYCFVIWVQNADEFWKDPSIPVLENQFSKKYLVVTKRFYHNLWSEDIFLRNYFQAKQEEDEEGKMENQQNDLDENLFDGHYILESIFLMVMILIFMTVPFQLGYQLFSSRL